MWWTSTHVNQVFLELLNLLGLDVWPISLRPLRKAQELLVVIDGGFLDIRGGRCLPSWALQEGIQSSVCKSCAQSATAIDHPLGGYYWSLLSGRNPATGD
jgi:hypothetical protein